MDQDELMWHGVSSWLQKVCDLRQLGVLIFLTEIVFQIIVVEGRTFAAINSPWLSSPVLENCSTYRTLSVQIPQA